MVHDLQPHWFWITKQNRAQANPGAAEVFITRGCRTACDMIVVTLAVADIAIAYKS